MGWTQCIKDLMLIYILVDLVSKAKAHTLRNEILIDKIV